MDFLAYLNYLNCSSFSGVFRTVLVFSGFWVPSQIFELLAGIITQFPHSETLAFRTDFEPRFKNAEQSNQIK